MSDDLEASVLNVAQVQERSSRGQRYRLLALGLHAGPLQYVCSLYAVVGVQAQGITWLVLGHRSNDFHARRTRQVCPLLFHALRGVGGSLRKLTRCDPKTK